MMHIHVNDTYDPSTYCICAKKEKNSATLLHRYLLSFAQQIRQENEYGPLTTHTA